MGKYPSRGPDARPELDGQLYAHKAPDAAEIGSPLLDVGPETRDAWLVNLCPVPGTVLGPRAGSGSLATRSSSARRIAPERALTHFIPVYV